MVEKRNESFLQSNVNKCTLEDFELTYWQLKELGPEEVKHRLVALREIQKSLEEAKLAMTKEAKPFIQGNSRNTFDLKERRKGGEFLSLPRLFPTICKVDRISGYKDTLSNKEQMNMYPEEGQVKRAKSKRKNLHRISQKDGKMCLNCKMETINEKPWLPQLNDVKAAGKVSREGAKKEKIVLPEIKLSKY